MRKLKIIEHISLDGVIQTSTSGPDDTFPFGDWTASYRSPAGLQIINEMYGSECVALLGRRTYNILANYWPKASKSVMADRLNSSLKLVVTHRPETLAWGPFEAITSDVAEAIRRFKTTRGPDIVVAGSGSLIATLLEHGLADEVALLVNPIVVGTGKRFFDGGGLPRGFVLQSSRALPTGILINVYTPVPTMAQEAVANAKLEREMDIAREVQQRLFPQTFPAVEGVEMAAMCRPAHAVGGDYYDLIDIQTGTTVRRLGIAMGDISGKGVSAALLMASLHASLRGQALGSIVDLGTKMANINRLLYEASESNRYATFFYAELDCATRTLYYVNGGHNPPAVLRDAEVYRLDGGGPVVGLLPGEAYTQLMFQLEPGDVLLTFTDGISEAMNNADQEWGEERMIAEAQKHQALPADELLRHLFQTADAFAAGAPQHDDMTLLILRVS